MLDMDVTPQATPEDQREDDSIVFADILQATHPPRRSLPARKRRNLTDLDFGDSSATKSSKKSKKKNAVEKVDDIDAMLEATEGDSIRAEKENVENSKSRKSKRKKTKVTKLPAKTSPHFQKYTMSDSSDDETIKTQKNKQQTKKKTKTKKVEKSKVESDWTESSADEVKVKKSKKPEKDETKEEPIVDAKYLNDGTLQIDVNKKGKSNPDQPEKTREEYEQAFIRSIINRQKTQISQFGHKLHLLSNLWLGLEWDKICDCPLVHGKILSFLSTSEITSEKSLKLFLTELNRTFYFPTTGADSGFPTPIGGLLSFDAALDLSQNTEAKMEHFNTKYGKFQHFIQTALLVSAFRAIGSIARLVTNLNVVSHKPQSKNQNEITKKKNEKKKKELEDSDRCIMNIWCEVYVEKRWIPITIKTNKYMIIERSEIESQLSWPVAYCVAFDGGVRDVTARYASQWLTETKKLRIKYVEKDTNWWKDTCAIWPSRHKELEKTENKELQEDLKQQGLPKTISAIKGHPLYVLRRHILKYEIIWPEDVKAIGQLQIKKKGEVSYEDIFARKAVKKLHTRGTWLQKAKVVNPAEVPVKMVASWMQNKKAGVDKSAANSGLFGEWQTAPFEPPIASNGKVPRNDHGNIDLFQECMLPIGCVWINDLQGPIVGRVCRKLNIDAAKAITGFEPKKGFPVIEGWVICEEFEETVRTAYQEVAQAEYKKNKEKCRARAKRNWRRLVTVYFVQKKVAKIYGNKAPDQGLQRILTSQERFSLDSDVPLKSSQTKKPQTKKQTSSKTKPSTSKYFSKRGKVEESESELEKSESEMSSESSEEETIKTVKKIIKKKANVPVRKSTRGSRAKTKYTISSDSSDFEHESEGEWN